MASAELPDVAPTTLYRHVARLAEAGVLTGLTRFSRAGEGQGYR